MEYIKLIWRTSKLFRVVMGVAGLGLVLALVTGPRQPPPAFRSVPPSTGVLERLKQKLPGSTSLPARVSQTAGNAVDVGEKAVDAAGKVVGIADRVVQRTSDTIDGVLGTKQQPSQSP